MVVDIDLLGQIDLDKILLQMEKLLCGNLEIRFYKIISKKQLEDTLIKVSQYTVNNLFLTLPLNTEFSSEYINNLLEKFNFVQYIHFYASIKNSIEINKLSATQIIHNTKNFIPEKECGQICQNLFNLSKKHYFESLNKNTCLNKKISIDINGNIKNCPSMKVNFGNIADSSLIQVLDDTSFKRLWEIKKDNIAICKDCEFRNICTDCRAFIEKPDDIYSKPLKCGYDPYTNKWDEWSTNPLKQKSIQYYKLK
jgi:SPASM domain peptide maturase of grasp-with-spasm system